MALSQDEIIALLSKPEKSNKTDYPRPVQNGPLRWYDKATRCASRGCGSQTYCKVEYVPYCMKHALDKLNDLVIEIQGREK
jgi:hypothetical protein